MSMAAYESEWSDDEPESLCGEPNCVHGWVVINDESHVCLECVRLGIMDRATGQRIN